LLHAQATQDSALDTGEPLGLHRAQETRNSAPKQPKAPILVVIDKANEPVELPGLRFSLLMAQETRKSGEEQSETPGMVQKPLIKGGHHHETQDIQFAVYDGIFASGYCRCGEREGLRGTNYRKYNQSVHGISGRSTVSTSYQLLPRLPGGRLSLL
jgi:hypothetical protein